jgi:hypothetical protein
MHVYTHTVPTETSANSRKSRVFTRDGPHSLDPWSTRLDEACFDWTQQELANAARLTAANFLFLTGLATGESLPG